ncbi:hypothetical protein [Paraburkholderia caffeinilytica]|uniref:hypothetical protein n=1 Tax=Paraburkholderia caffeinilytica TaxID=1761016 RepID=UPI003DA15EA7
MIVEQTTELAETMCLARQVSLIVFALMIVGTAMLAFSENVHLRLIGALGVGIGIGVLAASKLALWKA